jgi:hypothetical protein
MTDKPLSLTDLSQLKIAMGNLYPFVQTYYNIKDVVKRHQSNANYNPED